MLWIVVLTMLIAVYITMHWPELREIEMFFNVVTPLFQGVGITDLSITVALNNLGIAVSTALTATVVYRLWNLWVPLLAGATLHLAHRHYFARHSQSV